MRNRHIFPTVILAASIAGFTIDPATEASIDRAIQQASEEGVHQSSEIYYDVSAATLSRG